MKRSLLITTVVIAAWGLASSAQAAGNADTGKAKAAACAGCHGPEGKGVAPNPPLAGIPEAEQVQMLKDYKSGKRPNPIMKGLTAALSDQDMEDLSAYYASLPK